MKAITFTEDELRLLREQYEIELIEAVKYVERIKDILSKIGGIKSTKSEDVGPELPKRKGRKPKGALKETEKKGIKGRKTKVKVVESSLEVKKERKQRADKGKPRKANPIPQNKGADKPETIKETVSLTEKVTESGKKIVPKKKPGKKSNKKKGLVLKNLRKPLPKKAEPAPESDPEVMEP